ncbi:5-hydroxytryptamine receptor 2C-like [Oculina patagonica]
MLSPYAVFFNDYWFDTSLPSIIVYAVVSAFTIFSNVLLCVSYWKDPFRELRTAQNYYVLNLAIADLIMGAVSEPLLVVTYWYNHNIIYFIHYLFAIVSGSCSLLNITALSVIRYFAVKQPFLTQSIVNKRSVLISIGIIWLIAIHYAVIPLVGWRDNIFQLYLYGLACVIPCLVFMAAYFLVYRALRRHTNTVKRLGEGRSLALQNALRTEKAATRTVLLVLVVFLASWGPFLTIDFLIVQCVKCRNEQFHLARDITLSVVYFSSGINPVIYAWRVKVFRRAFMRVMGIDGTKRSLWKRVKSGWASRSLPALNRSKAASWNVVDPSSSSMGHVNESIELS